MDVPVDQEQTKWMDAKDMQKIMASKSTYKTILFSDGKTKLIDYLSTLENPKNHEKFLKGIGNVNVSLANDSPLWPGSTLLHLAVMFSANLKDEDKAALLVSQCLKQGALVQVQNQFGATPLHLAFRMDQQQIIALLMRSLELKSTTAVNLMDNDKLSFLHIACTLKDHRNSLARKLLLDEQGIKATVNVSYNGERLINVKPGWTPLHVAVDLRQDYLIELLLQQGADIYCTDVEGSTVIHQLFGTTRTKPFADVFFASDQLKDCVTVSTGLSHLHVAVWFKDVESVERLLDAGADIETTVKTLEDQDLKKFEGCSPLRIAIILQHVQCVRVLLSRDANILAKRLNDNTSPLSATLTGTCRTIAQIFVTMLRQEEKIQKLLEQELGLTELHIACYAGDIDKITTLVDQGANVNVKINDNSHFWGGYTPLHVTTGTDFMLFSEKKASIQTLLQNGCCLDQQDTTGKTTLHLAILSETYYSRDVVEMLLLAGADINIVDHSGKSAMSYALDVHLRCKWVFDRDAANYLISTLTVLLHKMKLAGIEVCQVNETHRTTLLQNSRNATTMTEDMNEFCDQLQEIEKTLIGRRGLTLRSFLCETGAVSMYPSLTPEDRKQVDEFFQSLISNQDYLDWKFLLNLQFRKAVARLSLIDPAMDALKDLVNPGFPDLCADIILKYLSNSELKLLIKASQLTD